MPIKYERVSASKQKYESPFRGKPGEPIQIPVDPDDLGGYVDDDGYLIPGTPLAWVRGDETAAPPAAVGEGDVPAATCVIAHAQKVQDDVFDVVAHVSGVYSQGVAEAQLGRELTEDEEEAIDATGRFVRV